jgi:hypothetical protein
MLSTRQILIIGALATGAGMAVWLHRPAMTWLQIDRCLDQGGRWDYASDSCEFAEPGRVGRLVLRDSAAYQLGLPGRELLQVDSLRVPTEARAQATRLRGELQGDTAAEVRYYAGGDGQFAALIPSWSFEGEDPHVVAVIDARGALTRALLPTYVAVEVYCPASGHTQPEASSRDSSDGCRYFHPVAPEAAPEPALGADAPRSPT